jgi:hypothetical protein
MGAWSYFALPQQAQTAAVDFGAKGKMSAVTSETATTGAAAPPNGTVAQSDYTATQDSRPLFAAVAAIGALISITLVYTAYKTRMQFR